MGTLRQVAVVLAVLGGVGALFGYLTVVNDATGSAATGMYVWLVFTGALVVLGGGAAMLSRTRGSSLSEVRCPSCGGRSEDDWSYCPDCGAPVPDLVEDVDLLDDTREWGEEGREPAAHGAENAVLGKALFWIGVAVLDVLFVLVVLWLFFPSLGVSKGMFGMGGAGPIGMILLDAGLGCLMVGYSLSPWAIRSQAWV